MSGVPTLVALAAAALVAFGPLPTGAPRALHFILADDTAIGHFESVTVPPEAVPAGPERRLQARLEALVREVEHHRRRVTVKPRVAFDQVGLREELVSLLAGVEGRAQVSVHVRDLETGGVLFDYAGHALLNPASNHKLLTSAASLDLLGPNYVFSTQVGVVGPYVYLIGQGDPTLDSGRLHEMAQDLAQWPSAPQFERIIVDDAAFSPAIFGPGYDSGGPGFAYQAPSGALSLDFNTVEVVAYPSRGRAPAVFLRPASRYVQLDNRARMGGRSTRLRATSSRHGDQTIVRVSGRMRRRGRPWSVRRRVYQPARYVGASFAAFLGELTDSEPIPVERGRAPEHMDRLRTYASAPLFDVVDRLLTYSNNFGAEQLLRTLGWRMTATPGDWHNGAQVLRRYWEALGNDASGLDFENGSGLSEVGRMSASGLVDLIETAHRHHSVDSGLIDALAVAGEVGTLRTRLRRSGRRVRAKTGTLRGVSALTGVIMRDDDTPQVAFSVLINARRQRKIRARRRRRVQDDIVRSMLRYCDDYESRRSGERAGPR
ncbi:MAG: D-alanyl-D-alanine carboxypeptidase/D-alanyl-D-alanine-endopeptidase [Nannocystaceae bacterium]